MSNTITLKIDEYHDLQIEEMGWSTSACILFEGKRLMESSFLRPISKNISGRQFLFPVFLPEWLHEPFEMQSTHHFSASTIDEWINYIFCYGKVMARKRRNRFISEYQPPCFFKRLANKFGLGVYYY